MKHWLLNHYNELLNTHSSPKSVAIGFSLGAFIAVLPTPGIGILLGLLTIFLFPKVSKLALFIAMAIFNPLVLTPIYAMNYQIGDYFLSGTEIMAIDFFAGNSFYHLTLRLLLGSVIMAFIIAVTSYFLVYYLMKNKK